MVIIYGEILFYASWVRSLKEKRSIVKKLLEKSKCKYNISLCETDFHDVHQNFSLGFTMVGNSKTDLEKIANSFICFLENNTDAVILEIFQDFF